MLDWANGGFLPKGDEGLKPTHTTGEAAGSRVCVWHAHTLNENVCVCLQTATLWNTRSLTCLCQRTSPAPRGPE